MPEPIQLSPHSNMTVEECLTYCSRNSGEFSDVLVIGYDLDGKLITRSSYFTRAEAVFLLLAALDHARGLE